MRIAPVDYETYETLILTGQIEASELLALLHDNPEFAEWYRERAKQRFNRKEQS